MTLCHTVSVCHLESALKWCFSYSTPDFLHLLMWSRLEINKIFLRHDMFDFRPPCMVVIEQGRPCIL